MTYTITKVPPLDSEERLDSPVFLEFMTGGKGRSTRRKRNGKKGRGKRTRGRTDTYIPDINQRPIQTRCFRYMGNYSNTAAFQTDDFQNMLGFVRNTFTEFYPLIDSFRLRRVGLTLFAISSTAGISPVTITWTGDNGVNVVDTMLVGNAQPIHQSFRPPEGSSAWFWHDLRSTTDEIMSITSSSTNIEIYLDVEIEYIVADGSLTNSPLAVAATFTGVASRKIGANLFTAVGINSVS